MKNFQDLATKFYSLGFSLKLRSLFIRIVAFALFIAIFLINMSWVDPNETNILSRLVGTIAASLIVPGLFMIIASPLTNMAIASLYLKGRQAKAGFAHTGTSEEAELTQHTRFTTVRKIATAATLSIAILLGSFSYLAMVPPSSIVTVPSVQNEKIADSENAWVEYNLAVQDVIGFPSAIASKPINRTVQQVMGELSVQQLKDPGYANLEKIAFGAENFTETELTYINKHQEAIKHLLAGAKLSKSQFSSEKLTIASPVPSLLQMRAISFLAAAETRHLQQQGKVKEAQELALANYKMATDIGSEPNASLISVLISVVCRGIASKSLIALVNSGVTDANMDIEIARQVSAMDRRMPNAYQSLALDLQVSQNSMEDLLVKGNKRLLDENPSIGQITAFDLMALLPGLRVRTYNNLTSLSQDYLNKIRPSLENWDFQNAEQIGEEAFQQSRSTPHSYSPNEFIANTLFYIGLPSGSAIMKSLYNGNSFGKALTVFATCSAYKKNHGQFPTTLESAFTEAGVSIPTDEATKKAIGYRLENNTPVVWLAGVDGQDNGGVSAYELANYTKATAGKDLIYTYGQLPLTK